MQVVGAKYFNDRLKEKFVSIDETDMEAHAFVVRGEEIIFSFKERVKQFLEDGKKPGFVEGNRELGSRLLAQHEYLVCLIAIVREIAKDFTEKLKTYNKESDKIVNASFPVMSFADAERITAQFSTFIANIDYKFMTSGSVRTYLPDRIAALTKLLN